MDILAKCDICGRDFTAHRKTEKRCSRECRKVYGARFAVARYRPVPERFVGCKVCGVVFKLRPKANAHNALCSPECRKVLRVASYERYKAAHPEKILETQRRFAQKPEAREYRAKWHKEHQAQKMARSLELRRSTPELRIRHNLRARMNQFVAGSRRAGETHKYIGCTCAELKRHLESKFKPGMTWENYGVSGWHIDHIKPMSAFAFVNADGTVNEAEMHAAMHFTNLQPLWYWENISKRGKFVTSIN